MQSFYKIGCFKLVLHAALDFGQIFPAGLGAALFMEQLTVLNFIPRIANYVGSGRIVAKPC